MFLPISRTFEVFSGIINRYWPTDTFTMEAALRKLFSYRT